MPCSVDTLGSSEENLTQEQEEEEEIAAKNDVNHGRYHSIMCANPFSATASFYESLAEAEAKPIRKTDNDSASSHEKIWATFSGVDSLGIHPPFLEHSPTPTRVSHFIPRSISDTAFMPTSWRSSLRKLCTPTNSPNTRNVSAFGEKESLSVVMESPGDPSKDNKYESDYEATPELRPPRSPFKKLFGERGILVRPVGTKDIPDPRYRKTGFVHWSGKLKQRVEDMSKDFTHKILSVDFNNVKHPVIDRTSSSPVTLTPFLQGDLYFQLELLLNVETNDFLQSEMQAGRLSVNSVKKVVDTWASKGRPLVVGFRYDIVTQRDLVQMNMATMHFAGVSAFTMAKLHSVLAIWRVLAKEISVRTFCQPDGVIRKHLHDAEKVLMLIGAPTTSMAALEEMRNRVLFEFYHVEKTKRESEGLQSIDNPWSPTMDNV